MSPGSKRIFAPCRTPPVVSTIRPLTIPLPPCATHELPTSNCTSASRNTSPDDLVELRMKHTFIEGPGYWLIVARGCEDTNASRDRFAFGCYFRLFMRMVGDGNVTKRLKTTGYINTFLTAAVGLN